MTSRGVVVISAALLLTLSACNEPTLDERAHQLIDRLGPMCQHFDFQLKGKVGDGEVRPVWCSEVDTDDEHPRFVLFVFSGPGVQDEWRQLPGAMRARHAINGEGWSAMSDQDILDEVEERLTD